MDVLDTLPSPTLDALGWSSERASAFTPLGEAGFVPGRLLTSGRDKWRAQTADGLVEVVIQRGFRRGAESAADFPAVGDWLALEPVAPHMAALRQVLPRTGVFARGRSAAARPDSHVDEQVLAANVDTALLVMALTRDENLRRLERYLALAWGSGADPAVLLNKSDLIEDVDEHVIRVSAVAGDTPVHAISARTGAGMEQLRRYLLPGRTVVLLGSSGVGKSTITNALLGEERQVVKDVREDDSRGRHTTVDRELFLLPSGALLIDTPGLRTVGLWDSEEGVGQTFADIDTLAERCRFGDCAHAGEPGCAVQAAIASGELSEDRLRSQRKLEREARSVELRSDVAAARAEGRRWGKVIKVASERSAARRNGWQG